MRNILKIVKDEEMNTDLLIGGIIVENVAGMSLFGSKVGKGSRAVRTRKGVPAEDVQLRPLA